jgi:hypothetical protein
MLGFFRKVTNKVTKIEKLVKNSKLMIIANLLFLISNMALRKLFKKLNGPLISKQITSSIESSISHNSRLESKVNTVIFADLYFFFSSRSDGEASKILPIPKNFITRIFSGSFVIKAVSCGIIVWDTDLRNNRNLHKTGPKEESSFRSVSISINKYLHLKIFLTLA